jgi:crossover junction endodeoxyribonuclease RuvC
MSLILGIDPGSRITGFGLIKADRHGHHYVSSGCIKLTSNNLHDNLHRIYSALGEIIEHHNPEEGAIEQIFMHNNPGSAIKLGQARGAAIISAKEKGVSLSEYSARQVKLAVVGYGAAKKEQVQEMVKRLLKLSGTPQADAADALAIAICHANSRTGMPHQLLLKNRRKGRSR